MEARALVRHKSTRNIGVITVSSLEMYFPGEVPVLWKGRDLDKKTSVFYDPSSLEVIGKEEPIADLNKCGAGTGKKACIFLAVGACGSTCLRFLSMHDELIQKAENGMESKRIPKKLFPECQSE